MFRRFALIPWLPVVLALAACTTVGVAPASLDAKGGSGVAHTVGDCQTLLSRTLEPSRDVFEGTRIGILSWNMGKGSKDMWQQDLRTMAAGQDLVLLQEAILAAGIEEQLSGQWHRSFSQGFTTRSRTSGVATYSKRKPVSECRLSVIEPLLRSRKATSVTEFGLEGRDDTLLVVNVHVVNISLGLNRFRDQMNQIRDVVAVHEGPAILSGDFNTWRQKRMDIVDTLARDFSFTSVDVHDDNRRTFNGHALDHVFVRGLTVNASQSKQVSSSDHNPIAVELLL